MTETEWVDSLKGDPAEIALEVAPLIDVGATVLVAEGTEALSKPDSTTVKAIARRVAYAAPAKIATVVLADGDNSVGQSDMTGDALDLSSAGISPRIMRGSTIMSPAWSVTPEGKILIKGAIAGDVLYVCQYDFVSGNRLNTNTRELWRRSLAEAGLTLVDGSFEEGATANNKTDAVWYIAGGQCYMWDSTFPKDVPAKSTPASTGGVGLGAWLSVGGAILRQELAQPDGADKIGSPYGGTISNDMMPSVIKKIGTFQSGALITDGLQALYDASSGDWYTYIGAIPGGGLTVLAGSSPNSSWVSVGLLNGSPINRLS